MKRLLIIAMLCTAPAVTWAQDTDDELDIDLLGDEEPASDDSKRLDRDDDLDFEFSEEEADNTDNAASIIGAPEPRANMGSILYEGKIYIQGGHGGLGFARRAFNDIYMFDPEEMRW